MRPEGPFCTLLNNNLGNYGRISATNIKVRLELLLNNVPKPKFDTLTTDEETKIKIFIEDVISIWTKEVPSDYDFMKRYNLKPKSNNRSQILTCINQAYGYIDKSQYRQAIF